MNPARAKPFGLSTDGLAVGLGVVLLVGTLAGSLALAAFGPSPWLALLIPGIGLGATVSIWIQQRHPLVSLAGVLILAAFALSRSEGVQVIELAFAAYLYTYFALWYGRRLFAYGESIVRDSRDAVLALFPILVPFTLTVSLSAGVDINVVRGEIVTYSMLWLYFPVREACERYDIGARVIAGSLMIIAAVSCVRNVFFLRQVFAEADYAWEVARARAPSNEALILTAALICLAIAASAGSRWRSLAGAVGFAGFAGGVILTQWRAYYVALALGALLLFVFVRGRSRVKLVTIGLSSLVGVAGLAYLVLGDAIALLALGLLDRVLSIGTAGTADISLLNRWLESDALWGRILESPLVGHGAGATFGFFDVTTRTTWIKPYSHNGYMHLWFKFGALGLGAFVYAWGRSAWDGWKSYRERGQSSIGLAAGVTLMAVVPSSYVSAPFNLSDVMLCFALLMGLSVGCRRRALYSSTPHVAPEAI